jgi:hypothetical protein
VFLFLDWNIEDLNEDNVRRFIPNDAGIENAVGRNGDIALRNFSREIERRVCERSLD